MKSIQKGWHSSGAVWELRWPSWAVRPNKPSGFRGRKELLNRATVLVTTCPWYVNWHLRTLSNTSPYRRDVSITLSKAEFHPRGNYKWRCKWFSKHRKCANTFICRLHILFHQYSCSKSAMYFYFLFFASNLRTSGCSHYGLLSTNEEQKKLPHDLFDICATHAGLWVWHKKSAHVFSCLPASVFNQLNINLTKKNDHPNHLIF